MRNLVPGAVLEASMAGQTHGTMAGSVLLLDAAGSTRLSAELSAYATAGAEALADILTAIFTPIVASVHRHGGFVAQFTGDGVLAVFPGDVQTSAPIAATAGVEIHAALAGLPALDTPAGALQLTVRTIVASGNIEWSVWSSAGPHATQTRAFTFLGSAVDEAQRGEPLVTGGQLAISERVRSALGVNVASEPLDGGYHLLTSFDRPASPIAAAETVAAPELAAEFNPRRVLHFEGRGEFRDVVSAFVALRPTPSPGSVDDPFPRLLDLIGAHGGYLCDVTRPSPADEGLTVFAFWGAPTAHERDLEHATRWVLALQEALGPEAVRAGITAETVFAGFVGSPRQEAYTCVGAGVNLAARMCGAADWGELLLGDQIPGRLPPDMTHTFVGAVSYRGFAEPIATHRLFSGADLPVAAPIAPPVGRDGERAELQEAIAAAGSERTARVIHISGEAGSGKSHLLDIVRATAATRPEPPLWLETRADEVRRDPFGPIRRALLTYFGRGDGDAAAAQRLDLAVRSLARRHPDLATELELTRRTLVGLAEGTAAHQDSVDARIRFESTVLSIEAMLIAEARSRSVVIDVRDAQWLDPSAASVLDRLRDDLAAYPIVLLVESRAPLPGHVDQSIALEGLERNEVRQIAATLLRSDVSDNLVELLMDRTAGNPFFVRQVVRFLQEQDLVTTSSQGADVRTAATDVPADLRPILIARLDRLSQRVRNAVLTAAVLGREFEVDVLAVMLHDRAGTNTAVAEAATLDIWSPIAELTYLFRQAMLRDAAYDMQLHSTLQRLHETAAEAITTVHSGDVNAHAGALAQHYDRARLPARALPFYVIAGKQAAQRFANERAIADFDRALELLGDAEEEQAFVIVDELVRIHDVVGDREAQAGAIARLERLAGNDQGRRLDAALRRASWHISVGEYDDAATFVDHAIGETSPKSTDERTARLLMMRARILRYLGDPVAAAQAAAAAQAVFADDGYDRGVAAAEDLQGGLAWEQGDYPAAIARHREAAHLFATAGDRVGEIGALNNLGTALFSLGDYPAARAIHGAGIRRSREIGYRMAESDHLDNRGGTAWAVGAYEEAGTDYAGALAIRRRLHDAWGIGISLSNLGAASRALGDHARAVAEYEEALAVDRSIGRSRGEAYDLHGLGLVQRDMEDYAAARSSLEAAIAIRDELGEIHLANESRVALADVFRRSGELDAALLLVDRAIAAEGDALFGGAVETTAALLHCYYVLAAAAPERGRHLLETMAAALEDRAARISDEAQRRSYLEDVPSHAAVIHEIASG